MPTHCHSYTFTLLLAATAALVTAGDDHHSKQKRQIFREQVLPLAGGKIPDGAFRSDRLALNRLNKEGIAIPDGVLLEARHRESHFGSHRHDPDIDGAIVRLVQRPDGRYAPPEGRYPFNNLVESTYIIRPPINHRGPLLPPQRVHAVTLRIPAKPFFSNEDEVFSFNHIDNSPFDVLTTFGPDLSNANVWTGFGNVYHEVPNRILRQTGLQGSRAHLVPSNHLQPPLPGFTAHQPTKTNAQSDSQLLKNQQTGPRQEQTRGDDGGYPSLRTIPDTKFQCSPQPSQMQSDPETNCQVFHLCHPDGRKESFLCPQGSRFDGSKNQCTTWNQVACPTR